jgi:hypothetical protein
MNRFEHANLSSRTSFHGHVVNATKYDLEKVCGKVMYSDNDITEKVQNEWEMQAEDGTPFTIYDWKEYREYDTGETIEWHIGAENRFGAAKGYKELARSFHLHPKIDYNI